MKKVLVIVVLIVAVLYLFGACNNKEDINNNNSGDSIIDDKNLYESNQENIIITPSNISTSENIGNVEGEAFKIAKVLDNIASVSKLNSSSKLTNSQIKEKFKFGELGSLEKEIRSNITEDNIKEIAIIKLENNDQFMPLFQAMTSRLSDLKEEYKDNQKITKILNSRDCYVLKQQGEVIISIISKNAKLIEEKMQESF